jgi:hypothetical protein
MLVRASFVCGLRVSVEGQIVTGKGRPEPSPDVASQPDASGVQCSPPSLDTKLRLPSQVVRIFLPLSSSRDIPAQLPRGR